METIQLTEAEQKRLDAFQMNGIRRILGIAPTTEEERYWTNERVWNKANEEYGKPIRKFTEAWQRAKYKLLGHIIRTDKEDPMRQ